MKMGVREFRERMTEVIHGTTPVVITSNGRRLGTFVPDRRPKGQEAWEAVSAGVAAYQASLRDVGIEPEDKLAEMGLDPWGAPLDEAGR